MRVGELASELRVDAARILEVLPVLGFVGTYNKTTSLAPDLAVRIREHFRGKGFSRVQEVVAEAERNCVAPTVMNGDARPLPQRQRRRGGPPAVKGTMNGGQAAPPPKPSRRAQPQAAVQAKPPRFAPVSVPPSQPETKPPDLAPTNGNPADAWASELGKLRRHLISILDLAEGKRNRSERGMARRINRLCQFEQLPRHIAGLMLAIVEFRNAAEYQDHVPTKNESDSVQSAWLAIMEWAQAKGWSPEPAAPDVPERPVRRRRQRSDQANIPAQS